MDPQNGWFIMDNPKKTDELIRASPILGNLHVRHVIAVISLIVQWD